MTQEKFKLTVKDVLIAGRKAIDNGQLQAYNKEACADGRCANVLTVDGKEFYCVIGLAYPEEFRNTYSITSLPGFLLDETSHEVMLAGIDITKADYKVLADLQKRHDDVVKSVAKHLKRPSKESAEAVALDKKRFRDQFRKLEIKHGLRPVKVS